MSSNKKGPRNAGLLSLGLNRLSPRPLQNQRQIVHQLLDRVLHLALNLGDLAQDALD